MEAPEGLLFLPSTGSTNEDAFRLLADGREEVRVASSHQTEGKGRGKSVWLSPPGSLALSTGRACDDALAYGRFLFAGLSLSVLDALRERRVAAWLKFPNDIYVREGKIAGTLVETRGRFAVGGVGVNLLPDGLQDADFPTASLKGETGSAPDPREFALELLSRLEELEEDGSGTTLGRWRSSLESRGERVAFTYGGEETSGVFVGVTDALRLQLSQRGRIREYDANSVVGFRVLP